MPSPVGHALGGLIAGWLVAGGPRALRREPRRSAAAYAAVFAAAGMAADVDLLIGSHRGPTHGIGAAIVAGCAAYLFTRRALLAAAIAAAYGSHIVLDWLGSDTTPPIGIMALWPLTRDYYVSSVPLFHAISRRYWQADFWILTLRAIARELIVLGPATAIVGFLRRQKRRF